MGPQRGTDPAQQLGLLRLIPALTVLLGYLAAVVGVALFSVPVALILGGVALVAFGFLVDVDRG